MMSSCFNNGAPFNNRTAAFSGMYTGCAVFIFNAVATYAVNAAGITIFITGCNFVLCFSCNVVMPKSVYVVDCCCNKGRTIESSYITVIITFFKSYFTNNSFDIDGNNRAKTVCKDLFFGYAAFFFVPGPYANRNACNGLSAGKNAIFGFGKSYVYDVFVIVEFIFCFETGCNIHIFSFPGMCSA